MRLRFFVFAILSCVCAGLPAIARAQSGAVAQATPTPAPRVYEHTFSIDYIPLNVTYNELSPGNVGTQANLVHNSSRGRLALEFRLWNVPLVAIGEFDEWSYPHDAGLVTTIGGRTQSYLPSFTVSEYSLVARLGVQIAPGHWYAAYTYTYRATNFGYPDLLGSGPGIEKLPDVAHTWSLSGYLYYYPEMHNPHPFPSIAFNFPLSYRLLTYDIGENVQLTNHMFARFGWTGENWYNRSNAPANETHWGPRIGLAAEF